MNNHGVKKSNNLTNLNKKVVIDLASKISLMQNILYQGKGLIFVDIPKTPEVNV